MQEEISMEYRDYIEEKYCDDYVKERDYLADRLIEAEYNLMFLKMAADRSKSYCNKYGARERIEIRIILRRIYVTVFWELALQIKAFTDDNDKDCLTVNKFKNNIFRYIKVEKKEEYYSMLGTITQTSDWNKCKKLVESVSDYRNKIIAHNIVNEPKLTLDIKDADFIISQYGKIFNVLNFQDEKYAERVADLYDETANSITTYLDAVLPLN